MNELGLNFVLVPGGLYTVGLEPEVSSLLAKIPVLGERTRDNKQAEVGIRSFQMADFPITNAEFEKFCPNHVRASVSTEAQQPVVDVTYFEARAFCERYGYRLPTAVEWEVAGRGANNQATSNSIAPSRERHNYFPSTGPNAKGSYPPNDFGIYDMSGNILELTSTIVKITEAEYVVILKGGSWGTCQHGTYLARQWYTDPLLRSNRIGFRVCKDVN